MRLRNCGLLFLKFQKVLANYKKKHQQTTTKRTEKWKQERKLKEKKHRVRANDCAMIGFSVVISETLYFQASEFRNSVSHPFNAKRTLTNAQDISYQWMCLFYRLLHYSIGMDQMCVCVVCNNDRMRSKIRNKIAAHSACVRAYFSRVLKWVDDFIFFIFQFQSLLIICFVRFTIETAK